MRPLRHLTEKEELICDRITHANVVIPIFFNPLKKRCKPQKENQLMALMIDTQQGRCILCGETLKIDRSLRSDHPDRPSFDHVVSKHKGGPDKGNRIAVHRQCNSKKSNRDPTGCELIWLAVVNRAIEFQNHRMFQHPRRGCRTAFLQENDVDR